MFKGLLVLFCFIISCREDKSVCKPNQLSHALKFARNVSIPLDTLTPFKPTNIYFFTKDREQYLVFDNFNNGRIDIIDWNTKQLHKTIPVSFQGPNGTGVIPSGMYFHNFDSIFLFSNIGQRLFLVDQEGFLQKRYNAFNEVSHPPIADLRSFMPAFYFKRQLHFGTYDMEYGKGLAGTVVDLMSDQIHHPYNVPEIYNTGFWDGAIHDRYNHDLNVDRDLIVQSYGNDHRVYVIDENDNKSAYCARSMFLQDEFYAYSSSKIEFGPNEQKFYKNEAVQGGYSMIKYDRWRKIYYRVVLRPTKESDYVSPQQIWESPTILIINSEFRVIGEFEIPEQYAYYYMFIGPEGLHLYFRNEFMMNDDEVIFGVFRIEEI